MTTLGHSWDDQTEFCTRCGMGFDHALNHGKFDCDGGGNLIAVSHIIARRQNKPLIDACIRAFQRPTDEPPQPPRAA